MGWKRSAEMGPRRDPQKSECAWLGLGWYVVEAAFVHVAWVGRAVRMRVRVRAVCVHGMHGMHGCGRALMVMRFLVPRW